MPYCHSCGSEIGEQDRFCKECGEPVGGAERDSNAPADTDRSPSDHSTTNRSTWFGLTVYHWGLVVVLALVQLGLTYSPTEANSEAEAQGQLAGRLIFALLFSVVIVFVLTKAYRYIQSR